METWFGTGTLSSRTRMWPLHPTIHLSILVFVMTTTNSSWLAARALDINLRLPRPQGVSQPSIRWNSHRKKLKKKKETFNHFKVARDSCWRETSPRFQTLLLPELWVNSVQDGSDVRRGQNSYKWLIKSGWCSSCRQCSDSEFSTGHHRKVGHDGGYLGYGKYTLGNMDSNSEYINNFYVRGNIFNKFKCIYVPITITG